MIVHVCVLVCVIVVRVGMCVRDWVCGCTIVVMSVCVIVACMIVCV